MILVPGLVPTLHRIAERQPRLRLIRDHLARFNHLRDDAAFADLDEVLALARHPNVFVKVSSLPAYQRESYRFKGIHKHIRRINGTFGPRRMLWGSNYTRLPRGYLECLDLFREALDFLTEDDQRWILGKAAAEASN